jgi:hypothetical protein
MIAIDTALYNAFNNNSGPSCAPAGAVAAVAVAATAAGCCALWEGYGRMGWWGVQLQQRKGVRGWGWLMQWGRWRGCCGGVWGPAVRV